MPRIRKKVVNYPHNLQVFPLGFRSIDFAIKTLGKFTIGHKVSHYNPEFGIGYIAFFNSTYPIVYFPNSTYSGAYGNQLLECELRSLTCLE